MDDQELIDSIKKIIKELDLSQSRGMYQDQRMAHVWYAQRLLTQLKEKLDEISKQNAS